MRSDIRAALRDRRALILDGGFGTMVQALSRADNLWQPTLRSPRLTTGAGVGDLTGLNDILCLTRPDVVAAIHRSYLEAGADIITTNSFNAQRISLADYHCERLAADINVAAARIARDVADEHEAATSRRCYVAGSVGPTNKTLSISPDIDDPACRSITFDELEAAYHEQIAALIDGGVDVILIETVFDTLNAKAALHAAMRCRCQAGNDAPPVMLSATVSDLSLRTLSGQTLQAFVASVSHAADSRALLSIGLNCGFGAAAMQPPLRDLANHLPSGCALSVHPNAGLPNAAGEYDETPELFASHCRRLIDECHPAIIGGCCGTTPAHIRALKHIIEEDSALTADAAAPKPKPSLTLSGLDALPFASHEFVAVGERCNVAGSRKFLRLIKEKHYDEALAIARSQVCGGAMVIDVNLDDALLDSPAEMRHFLNLLASDPEASRVPVMIDSSDFRVIVEGLKCLQGKGIVNSLSLKEGEETLIERARVCRSFGAAIVFMLFDEQGQATTFERRIEIAARGYRILTERAGVPASDIIFDPNVLAVATGMPEHDAYAADFIRAVEWIRHTMPDSQISGGVSNLSFSFRGNNYLREAMHAVFLRHARAAGLNMAIVNAATMTRYDDIPLPLRDYIEDVILHRRADASERLIEAAASLQPAAPSQAPATASRHPALTVGERLVRALIEGESKNLEGDIREALDRYPDATAIIDGPLMDGMRQVGDLFAGGHMFLPQVVKTARTMKQAVALLRPHIEAAASGKSAANQPHVLIATVKGDVHDIGKNIVSVVMQCGGYRVTDLGVMVPAETIVEAAKRLRPDIIALSGLITPSLAEMTNVVTQLKAAGIDTPVMIGGATTSPTHTALRIAPAYDGPVIHVSDASQNAPTATRLLSPSTRAEALSELRSSQRSLRDEYALQQSARALTPIEEARLNKPDFFGTCDTLCTQTKK